MDAEGNTAPSTRQRLSIVKALVPATLQRIADDAIQVHGAAGLSQDTPLCSIWAGARMLRLADGPDAVHWRRAGQFEFGLQRDSRLRDLGYYTPPRDDTEPTFRRTTDPVSEAAASRVAAVEAALRAPE